MPPTGTALGELLGVELGPAPGEVLGEARLGAALGEEPEQYWRQKSGTGWGCTGEELGPELGETPGAVLGDAPGRAGFQTRRGARASDQHPVGARPVLGVTSLELGAALGKALDLGATGASAGSGTRTGARASTGRSAGSCTGSSATGPALEKH
jgi:hypothetical protein